MFCKIALKTDKKKKMKKIIVKTLKNCDYYFQECNKIHIL